MSDQPETIADILREIRMSAFQVFNEIAVVVKIDTIKDWADRIEAAAKREREINQKILAAANDANAILKDDRDRAIQFANAAPHPGSVSWKEMHEVYAKARAILSAVPQEGNVAALREALVKIEKLNHYDLGCVRSEKSRRAMDAKMLDIELTIRAALTAPARNCDRFKTEGDAHIEYLRIFDHPDPVNYAKWLFAPAEGGAE